MSSDTTNETKKLATAELFATVRESLATSMFKTESADVALAELERRMGAMARARRLALEQIESMRAECCRRAVLNPEDITDGLERLRRILGDTPERRP